MEQRLEETIIEISEWINEQLDCTSSKEKSNILPLTISALAELVRARAESN